MYLTVTRKRVTTVILTVLLAGLVAGIFLKVGASGIDGSTAEARLAYIRSLGCDASECREKEVTLPQKAEEVYAEYEKLQNKAGFKLAPYYGSRVTVYTYTSVSYPLCSGETQLNLIVCRGRIIGGDISETALNGKMLPLVPAEGNKTQDEKTAIG